MSFMVRIALMALGTALFASSAYGWTLDSESSAISYATIKNADTAEANVITGLTGGVDDNGNAQIEIDLATVETHIDTRNDRMREHVFQIAQYPVATLDAQLDMASLIALTPGQTRVAEFEVTVAANGTRVAYPVKASVTRVGEDKVTVAAYEPVLLSADDFGWETGIEKLREIAGLDSIQLVVPTGFTLVFSR